MRNHLDIELVIAGPGGGKTHNMVEKVLNCINKLSSSRYCAVITYTNAATENIKTRVENLISIPENVFIGTTHSFLIKFVFEPFAHLFDIAPTDKNYIEAVTLPFSLSKVPAFKRQFVQKNLEIKTANELLTKGLVTYDKILEKSFELLNNESVLKKVSNRLQFIFIDEYQDSRVYQHLIIEKILQHGKTKLYCIGDPLQSIFRFAYFQSQLKNEPKPKCFQETPLLDLLSRVKKKTTYIKDNHRSSPPIVRLINKYIGKFNYEFQQNSVDNNSNIDYPVCFVTQINIKKIYENFNKLKLTYGITDEEKIEIKNLFLSDEWSLFENVSNELNISRLIKDNTRTSSFFGEVMRITNGIIGLKKREILSITSQNENSSGEVSYRKFCLRILRTLGGDQFNDDTHRENTIRKMFREEFNVELKNGIKGKVEIHKTVTDINAINGNISPSDFYSTIHTAKGLEATSVLVCAKTQNQLLKWLDIDKVTSDDDDFRLGYVAFSRARQFLCIACLQQIDQTTADIIESLGIKIVYG